MQDLQLHIDMQQMQISSQNRILQDQQVQISLRNDYLETRTPTQSVAAQERYIDYYGRFVLQHMQYIQYYQYYHYDTASQEQLIQDTLVILDKYACLTQQHGALAMSVINMDRMQFVDDPVDELMDDPVDEQARLQEQARLRERTKLLEHIRLEQVKRQNARPQDHARRQNERLQEHIRRQNTRLQNARLDQAKHEQAELETARLEQAKHEQAKHEQVELENARLEQARLEQAEHEQAEHEQAEHEQARLEQAKHEQAELEQARLEQVKLEQAKLHDSMHEARLHVARLHEAHLHEARLHEQAMIELARLHKVERSELKQKNRVQNTANHAASAIKIAHKLQVKLEMDLETTKRNIKKNDLKMDMITINARIENDAVRMSLRTALTNCIVDVHPYDDMVCMLYDKNTCDSILPGISAKIQYLKNSVVTACIMIKKHMHIANLRNIDLPKAYQTTCGDISTVRGELLSHLTYNINFAKMCNATLQQCINSV